MNKKVLKNENIFFHCQNYLILDQNSFIVTETA